MRRGTLLAVCGCIALPVRGQHRMSTVEICRQVESHSCCIDGVTHTFEVYSASMVPGSYGGAVLHIGGYRHTASGTTLIARMRIRAALPELEVSRALDQSTGRVARRPFGSRGTPPVIGVLIP